VISTSVCVSVCLTVHSHNSKIALPNFAKFFVHVPRGHGSGLRRRRCDTLCTAGFTDDVILSSCHRARLYVYEKYITHVAAGLPAGHGQQGRKLGKQSCWSGGQRAASGGVAGGLAGVANGASIGPVATLTVRRLDSTTIRRVSPCSSC